MSCLTYPIRHKRNTLDLARATPPSSNPRKSIVAPGSRLQLQVSVLNAHIVDNPGRHQGSRRTERAPSILSIDLPRRVQDPTVSGR